MHMENKLLNAKTTTITVTESRTTYNPTQNTAKMMMSKQTPPKSLRKQKTTKPKRLSVQSIFGSILLSAGLMYLVIFLTISLPSDSNASTSSSSFWDGLPVHIRRIFDSSSSSIQAFDLSVNHLQKIDYWDGALNPEDEVATHEDFMPVVESNAVDLRWRMKTLPGADGRIDTETGSSAIRGITAYRIIAEYAYSPHTLIWDSGKIDVSNYETPRSIEWPYVNFPLKLGLVVRWKVLVWDGLGKGPSESDWSKFAVGPSQGQWKGQWITHPVDFQTLNNKNSERVFKAKHMIPNTPEQCNKWKRRQPLPLARVEFDLPRSQVKQISSAVLFAGGLGMFSTTLNGKRLSSSSVHDPPLTDFSQRVNYRGFDVTNELTSASKKSHNNHVVGITLASGWWDGRPIKGAIVFMSFMAQGSLTTIAELHVTYKDGTSEILIPTDGSISDSERGVATTSAWKMGKGPLKNSNLFTGETMDLVKQEQNQGWDTVSYDKKKTDIVWVAPELYRSTITNEEWRKQLDNFAGTLERKQQHVPGLAPIGRLIPLEQPPVLPQYRIPVSEVIDMGNGRWILDFGKGMSGVVRFEKGLPPPIKPVKIGNHTYPRGHDLDMITQPGDQYITVIHGDSLEMSTGDVNLALVAGFGHHAGGERGTAKQPNVDMRGGPCFPLEDLKNYQALTQRDVYLVRKSEETGSSLSSSATTDLFKQARQPKFTVHGFRYAEICCTETPPIDAYAIQYRTAFPQWGDFSSSNPTLNGAFELTRNALESNMLGIQSDCPHRERLQYGGDLVAASPSAMHIFDLSAFYGKIIRDWTTSQFDNGAYGVTSTFMDLLPDQSVASRGSGETIWAAAPVILGARHMHHYGDTKLAIRDLNHHVEWLKFLEKYWEGGIIKKYGPGNETVNPKYHNEVRLKAQHTGLGDWYTLRNQDCWFTHNAFYMACARTVAYLATWIKEAHPNLIAEDAHSYNAIARNSLKKANDLQRLLNSVYNTETFEFVGGSGQRTYLGQSIGLFAKVAPGQNRCKTLKSMLKFAGHGGISQWPGDEERLFFEHLNKEEYETMKSQGLFRDKGKIMTLYKERYAEKGGILGIGYSLKTLSEMGFHTLALTKASGNYFPSYGMMMSFNATTLWETWWRSEDIFSRDHPMLGAVVAWLFSSVGGISVSPTSLAGDEVLLWPKISDTVESSEIANWASATQGTKKGDAAVAWKLVNGRNNTKIAVIRALVPPGSTGMLRLPFLSESPQKITSAATLPDFDDARRAANTQCEFRRKTKKYGFPFYFDYNRGTEIWRRVNKTKAIGTPCQSFLFQVTEDHIEWIDVDTTTAALAPRGGDVRLQAGFYEILIANWKIKPDLEQTPGYGNYEGDMGQYCSDPSTFDWDLKDAEHII